MNEKKQSLLNIRMELIIKFINDIQNYHIVRKILSKPPSCCIVLDSIIPGSKFYNLIHENNLKELEKKKEQKKQKKFEIKILKQTEIDLENEQILANAKLYKFKHAKNPSCFGQKSFNKILIFFNGLNEMEFLYSICKEKVFNLIKECLENVVNPFEIVEKEKEKKFKFVNKKNLNQQIQCKNIFKNEFFNKINMNEFKIFYNSNVFDKLNSCKNNNFFHKNFNVNIINNNNFSEKNFNNNNNINNSIKSKSIKNKNIFNQKAKNLKLDLNSSPFIKRSRNFISNLSYTTINTKNNLKSINSNLLTTFTSNSKFKQFSNENKFFKEINNENNKTIIKNKSIIQTNKFSIKNNNLFNNFKYLNEKNIEKIKSKSNKKELKNIYSMNNFKFYDFNYDKLLNLRIHTKLKRPKTNNNNNNNNNNNKNFNKSHSFHRKNKFRLKTQKI